MKKTIALIVAATFVLTLASISFGRTYEEEMQAVRDYLNVVDAKLATAKQAKNTTRIRLLHVEKAATLARWNKLKATMQVAPPPPPPTIAAPPPPPPPPVKAAPTGLLGLGVLADGSVGLVAGNMMGAIAGICIPDPMGISKDIHYKVGLGYAQGNDKNGNAWKAVPIVLDAVMDLPPDMLGGIGSYVGGGINYVVYRTGQTGGSIGGQVYGGIQGDLGLGGTVYGQVGIGILRTGTTDPQFSTGYALSLMVGQKIVL